MDTKKAGRALAGESDMEARREAARILGSARTERKIAAAREMGRKFGNREGRPVKPLSEIPCICGAGDVIEGHKSYCLRGKAIKRRLARGQPID